MIPPIVSIVTTSFNRADLLPRLWKSMCSESMPFEWVVVDDASSDSTAAVVEGFRDSRVLYHRLDRNQGCNIARNHGVRAARGRFILFIDSDDELAPNALEEAVKMLEMAPSTIGALLMNAEPTYREGYVSDLQDGAVLSEEDLVVHNRLHSDHAVLYRTEVFLKQMLPMEYRESSFVFVFGISRWWNYLVINRPLTLVHRQEDNLSQARSILGRSSAIARGWEDVIVNHAEILRLNPHARRHLYGRVLYRYAVAGDWTAVRRVFKELRAKHPGLLDAISGTTMALAGTIGRYGGDYLRMRWARFREEGLSQHKQVQEIQ